jgi:hypothetical protein
MSEEGHKSKNISMPAFLLHAPLPAVPLVFRPPAARTSASRKLSALQLRQRAARQPCVYVQAVEQVVYSRDRPTHSAAC